MCSTILIYYYADVYYEFVDFPLRHYHCLLLLLSLLLPCALLFTHIHKYTLALSSSVSVVFLSIRNDDNNWLFLLLLSRENFALWLLRFVLLALASAHTHTHTLTRSTQSAMLWYMCMPNVCLALCIFVYLFFRLPRQIVSVYVYIQDICIEYTYTCAKYIYKKCARLFSHRRFLFWCLGYVRMAYESYTYTHAGRGNI